MKRSLVILFVFFSISLSYLVSADINDGLVGHWTFDETSGTTAADSSGNGNTGTLVNESTWVNGKVGSGALQFDGFNDYVTVPDSISISSIEGSNQMTTTYWIRRNSTTAVMGILSRLNAGKLFAIYSDANFPIRPQWRYSGSGTGGTTLDHGCGSTICSLPVGEWHHVAVIYDAPTSYIYVDGQLKHSKNGTGGALNSNISDPLFIGKYAHLYLDGSIDDIYLYNRALSALEVEEVYQLGLNSSILPGQPIAPLNTSNATIINATVEDTTSPVISGGYPFGVLQSGTREIILYAVTDEKAVCRYTTSGQTPFSSMTGNIVRENLVEGNIFLKYLSFFFRLYSKLAYTGLVVTDVSVLGMTHSFHLTGLEDGQNYTYYIKCQDETGNINTEDYVISFSVDSRANPSTAQETNENDFTEGNFADSPTECELTRAYWSSEQVEKGEEVSLIVEGTGCEGKEAKFEIYEVDPLTRSEVQTAVASAVVQNGKAQTNWNAQWECETSVFGNCINNPEYKFVASVNPVIESEGVLYVVDAQPIDCAHPRVICVDDTPGATRENATIQQCANSARPGDICLVWSGDYPEHVTTKFGGTNNSRRITFKANGAVTMKGFWIMHPYITVEGFDITGGNRTNLASITIFKGGDSCQIINNVIRDGAVDVRGIYFYLASDLTTGNNCVIHNNIIKNLNYTFLNIVGVNHSVEGNTFERLNNQDYMYVFGNGHVFRRNIFREGNEIPGLGNHPDWVQTFGDSGLESYNMLFEENWIENVDAQLGQIDGGSSRGIADNIRDWTFRNNIFINVSNNMNTGLPGLRWEHNTFYRMAHTQAGIGAYGSLVRGNSSRNVLINNAFVAGGWSANVSGSTNGFYNLAGAFIDREVFRAFATNGSDDKALAIAIDLSVNGYLKGPNGDLTNKARALTDSSQFVVGDTNSSYRPAVYVYLALIFPGNVSTQNTFYTNHMGDAILPYKSTIYDLLTRTTQLDLSIRTTTVADYNFVAGSGPNYYPKLNSTCNEGIFTKFYFCEEHGINGGNPRFANEFDPDGPDNIPFTIDDGLKPLPGSPLCGRGMNGTDIGLYSCNPSVVFADGSPAPSPTPVNGLCSSNLNTCTNGTFSDQADTPTEHLWQCLGRNGGTSASCSLPKTGDTTLPTVSITSPSAGSSVSGSVMVNASASDDIGVVGVQFKVNGVNLGTEDTVLPYSVTWDTTSLSDGSYALTATARDAAGNTMISNPVNVTKGIVVVPLPSVLPCPIGPRTIRAYSVIDGNSIRLVWPQNIYRQDLQISRRVYSDQPSSWQNWVQIHTIIDSVQAQAAGEYRDTNVTSGVHYEYQISGLTVDWMCNGTSQLRPSSHYRPFQYINTGIAVPLKDSYGKVILLVENSLATPLASEISRLENDLIGDGYKVYRHDVAASEVTDANWRASVASTKAIVRADYNTDTSADWTIFVVGHVPIPYSGLMSPGSHTENYGAHPADWYYADMDESGWTDTTVNDSSAIYVNNKNIPLDGKFDQNFPPSTPELRIGRIDLKNMPAFGKSEVELLRQYLNREHAWRHKLFTVRDRALVNANNNAGLIYEGRPFESHGVYSSYFGGLNSTDIGSWLDDAKTPATSYLFSASNGNGDFTRDYQIGRTTEFAATPLYIAFTSMYGSYYGDWDNAMHPDSVLLAPLANVGYVVSNYYRENVMNIDSSSMGKPIGQELFSLGSNFFPRVEARYTQFGWIYQGQTFGVSQRTNNYVTLMGDPTLRTRVVAPPTNVVVSVNGSDHVLFWNFAADTDIAGYHVYRALAANLNNFTRITSTPVTGGSFRDVGAATGAYSYMVRTVKLAQSASRSYYTPSIGIFATSGAAPTQICGNNIIETGEMCDGNSRSCIINGYSGTQACNVQCSGFSSCTTTQRCGDAIRNGNEQCDDGNLIANDLCTNQCTWNTLCTDSDRDGLPDYDVNTCPFGSDRCVQNVSNWNTYVPHVEAGQLPANQTLNVTYKPSDDFRNMSNFSLRQEGRGNIVFLDRMRIVDINTTGCFIPLNITKYIQFSDKRVVVRSDNFSEFNKPALITFENVSFIEPKLLRDGVDCGSLCILLSYNNSRKTVVVNVTGFSTYEVVEGYVPVTSSGGNPSSGGGGGSSGSGRIPIQPQNQSSDEPEPNIEVPIDNGSEETKTSATEETPTKIIKDIINRSVYAKIAFFAIVGLLTISIIVTLVIYLNYLKKEK